MVVSFDTFWEDLGLGGGALTTVLVERVSVCVCVCDDPAYVYRYKTQPDPFFHHTAGKRKRKAIRPHKREVEGKGGQRVHGIGLKSPTKRNPQK